MFVKNLLKILIVICILKFHHYFTDGFKYRKIINHLPYDISMQRIDEKSLNKILKMNFYYLDKGKQSYVFESSDHQYVIKLLRYNKYFFPFSLKLLPSFFTEFLSNSLYEKTIRYERAMESYRLAVEDLYPITNVIAVDLNKKKNYRLQLYDRMRRKFSLRLDSAGFILQKKGKPLVDALNQDWKNSILSYYQMILFRLEKGIKNRDFANYIRNSGILNNEVFEIDVGSFYKEEMEMRKEMQNAFTSFFEYYKNEPEKRIFIQKLLSQ